MSSAKKPLPGPRTSKRVNSPIAVRADAPLWLVCFQSDIAGLPDAPQQSQSFQLVVRAKTPKAALDTCRLRLRELRTTSSLFDAPCSIYLDHLIAIEGVSATAALVNYVSKLPSEQGIDGEILCAVPEQQDVDVEVFGPRDGEGPFLDFGGQHANQLLRRMVQGNAGEASDAPVVPTSRRRRGPR